MSKARWTIEELKLAVKESNSFREVAAKIYKRGCSCVWLNKKILQLGIDTSHFTCRKPGHSKYQSLVGKTYGYLYINSIDSKNKNIRPNYYADCTCKCGKQKEVLVASIVRGLTRSCGCILNDIVKKGINSPNYNGVGELSGTIFKRIKRGADKRGIPFNLTKEFLWDLFIKQERKCALSGVEIFFAGADNPSETTASLDRKDNDKPYTEDNVWWVHKSVNIARNNMTIIEFVNMCNLVSNKNKIDDNVVMPIINRTGE